ncbi:hypothetical protein [Aridibaculum aurantiacum]|uniref:hypothetical protein n=1 Tax=Aridibaculum aurantiacum TaxID=2810307 RepID=UPI001A979E6A|nr:hypothetical protein [Aridibaculum aurantiacum]
MKPTLYLFFAIFLSPLFAKANCTLPISEASKHVGDRVSICGRITGSKAPATNAAKTTYVQLDQGNSSTIQIVIRMEDRKHFSYKPEEYLYQKQVCVTGIIAENNGRTEILVKRPEEIKFEEDGSSEIRSMDLDGFNRFFGNEDE